MADYSNLAFALSGLRRRNPGDMRSRMGEQMMGQGADYSPIDHPLQGLDRIGKALTGAYMMNPDMFSSGPSPISPEETMKAWYSQPLSWRMPGMG